MCEYDIIKIKKGVEMEQEKNNKGVIALVVVLCLIVLGLGGYIVYDKVLCSKENPTPENNITSDNSDNFNALSIVKTNFKKMIQFMHSVGPYCGERNKNDYIVDPEEISIRWELSSYSNMNELNNYLKSFMTDSVISIYTNSNYIYDLYKEQNGKLYCLSPNKAVDFRYSDDKISYKIINTTDESISAVITFDVESFGYTYNYVSPIELIKNSNGNWLVSSYFEIITGDMEIDIVKSIVLNDIIEYNEINTNHKISIIYGTKTAASKNDITSLKDNIKENYESPNGTKWVKIKVNYDENGYVNQLVIE